MIKIYNTLTRKTETFIPLKKEKVSLYSCGPTVYDYVHIGNLRAYVFTDILKKYFAYRGYLVKHIMNITDVDDKTIKNSIKSNKSLKEYTNFYLEAFLSDLKLLNIELPGVMPLATDHIREMVSLIKILGKKGYTYKSKGSIYFKISRFKNYGRLAQLEKQDLKENASGRLNIEDEYGKEDANDFVLWKAWQPEDGNVFWDTELGRGRPGWHIECSAMSIKYLGEKFDMHSGGIDLIFPHHTNEIAQSESATGEKFVNYWLHNAHLLVDEQKMSKSLNNFYTSRDIQNRRYNMLLLRLILLKTHYRQKLNFTFSSFADAKAIANKFLDFLIDMDLVNNKKNSAIDVDSIIEKSRADFIESMDNDLNISIALSSIFDFMSVINKVTKNINTRQAKSIKSYIFELDKVLGFVKLLYGQYNEKLKSTVNSKEIRSLIITRGKLRLDKKYIEADKIRKQLMERGVIVNDLGKRHSVRLANFL